MPVLPSNQLTGFYMRATQALNGLILEAKFGIECLREVLIFFTLMNTLYVFHKRSVMKLLRKLQNRSAVEYIFCRNAASALEFYKVVLHIGFIKMQQMRQRRGCFPGKFP